MKYPGAPAAAVLLQRRYLWEGNRRQDVKKEVDYKGAAEGETRANRAETMPEEAQVLRVGLESTQGRSGPPRGHLVSLALN